MFWLDLCTRPNLNRVNRGK
ncbi:hypothetical protein F383_26292 [Gossypium arboreum]|uniref:Uncharacterized protein n=1 Tax=Gossypium arboreum TaxID=29729 RepID=A0A0B0P1D1_GOSAR|nr:hypothetical protein F383_26292 [Gossypium arboreum]